MGVGGLSTLCLLRACVPAPRWRNIYSACEVCLGCTLSWVCGRSDQPPWQGERSIDRETSTLDVILVGAWTCATQTGSSPDHRSL